MNKYTYYGSGAFQNTRYIIEANTKKEAIEKVKRDRSFYGITISTMRKVKEATK